MDTELLELRLLGPLEALAAGEPVLLSGRKPKALLALLALQPEQVASVDRLVEELWPAGAPDTAEHAVKVHVSQLRKALGAGAIATRGSGYALDLHPNRVDAHRFRSLLEEGRAVLASGEPARAGELLREAIALWRGPALVDFAYEPFAQAAIAELEELRLAALEERIEADLALGLHGELVGELKLLVAANATRERVWGQLMLALYRAGRQADALATYRTARKALVEGLGIEPGPELRELEAAILRQDPALLLEAAPAAPVRTRRRVTVLSVDVETADGLDTELEHGALTRAAAAVTGIAARYGATAQRPGDGSLVVAFGVPVAHEDDALRAARCALEARDAVAAVAAQLGVEPQFRAGIETGEIVSEGAAVEGRPVRVAARLRQSAAPGEIAVGDESARTLRDAAVFDGDRLVELVPAAAPFARTLDGPLVGRVRELRALKGALRKVTASGTRAVLVTGTAGIGKSRLALELGRTRGVTTIVGKCPAYGDGLTYAPLRGLVAAAVGASDLATLLEGEPEAELTAAALAGALGDADTQTPAAEVALAFRRLCEALARRRPLLVVLDDLHWAQPTFLELVEHLVDRAGAAPILVVGLAREELSEQHPRFLAERDGAERLELGTLTPEETATLLAGLADDSLTVEQGARILETAEGNPLYVEQLLALAGEGGLAGERPLPDTIESLLAARLDRLGPAERMMLGRGAVVGRSFGVAALTALLVPEAVPSVERHLGELVARGFLREDGAGFRFRHVLLQEAAYRATPKAERAELHERHADLLAQAEEPDELVGYHLERAHRLRTEVGLGDRHTAQLAEDAGGLLGAAGLETLKRGDMHTGLELLSRATALLPEADAQRRALLCELAVGQRIIGDAAAAETTLEEALHLAVENDDRRTELRASVESAYLRLLRSPDGATQALLDVADLAMPTFGAVADDRSMGRTWLLVGFVQGGLHCQEAKRAAAAERAVVHYRRSGWPVATCLGELAYSLHHGPTTVPEGTSRLRELLRDATDRWGEAHLLLFLGGLEAQAGDDEMARRRLDRARETYRDLGQSTSLAEYWAPVAASVELLAGRVEEARAILLDACLSLERAGDVNHLSSVAADLADILVTLGQLTEAERWVETSREAGGRDDLLTQIGWRRADGRVHAHRGRVDRALPVAHEAVNLAEQTDRPNTLAECYEVLAEVAELAGHDVASRSALSQARANYARKENAAALRRLQARPTPASGGLRAGLPS